MTSPRTVDEAVAELDVADEIARVQETVGSLNASVADAVDRVLGPGDSAGDILRVKNAHGDLADAYADADSALTTLENLLDRSEVSLNGGPTPRRLTKEHAERLKEQYDGPVCHVALQLLEPNRREWLWRKRGTIGAENVERHGLTENQRRQLNDLQEAWREYDG